MEFVSDMNMDRHLHQGIESYRLDTLHTPIPTKALCAVACIITITFQLF